jgi:hypothetical protein
MTKQAVIASTLDYRENAGGNQEKKRIFQEYRRFPWQADGFAGRLDKFARTRADGGPI